MQVVDFTSYREKVSKQMKFPNRSRNKVHYMLIDFDTPMLCHLMVIMEIGIASSGFPIADFSGVKGFSWFEFQFLIGKWM